MQPARRQAAFWLNSCYCCCLYAEYTFTGTILHCDVLHAASRKDSGHMVKKRSPLIVVVDDERDILDLLCDALEDEGYQVLGFTWPPPIDTLQRDVEPTLFLLDIMLPDIDGIRLARQLKAERFPETPMVAMSASAAMLEAAAEAEVFEDTLPKPFDLSELLDTVERYAA